MENRVVIIGLYLISQNYNRCTKKSHLFLRMFFIFLSKIDKLYDGYVDKEGQTLRYNLLMNQIKISIVLKEFNHRRLFNLRIVT